MRALTVDERLVLEAMIRHAHSFDAEWGEPSLADRQRWLAMVDDLSVHGICGCGTCPTINLAHKGVPVEWREEGPRMVLEADIQDALVLLFIDDDVPSCLEVAPLDEASVALPSPEEINFR